MRNTIIEYQTGLIRAIQALPLQTVETIATLFHEVKTRGNTVYVLGNGGSAATPSHSAGDWTHAMSLKTVCLTDNASVVTAIANDNAYDDIFKRQLEIFLREGDVVIGMSGSGNSPNVLKAIDCASLKGITTIGLTGNYMGKQGGKLAMVADIVITVDSTSMEQIEDLHLIITHLIKDYFLDKFGK